MSAYSISGSLEPTPPFDFAKSLGFLRVVHPVFGGDIVSDDGFRLTASFEGQSVVLKVANEGDTERPKLSYALTSNEAIDAEISEIARHRLKGFLSIDDDLTPFYRIAESDPYMSSIVSDLYGYHHVRFFTPFEAACWSVLAQRNGVTAALTMKRRMVEHLSDKIEIAGQCFAAFPEPLDIVRADPNELYALLPNLRRAEYMAEVARGFMDIDESEFSGGDYDSAEKRIREIKGVGTWSAGFILMRGFGRMERVPRAERRLVEMASKVYGHGNELTESEILKIASEYKDNQGHWFHYLRASETLLNP